MARARTVLIAEDEDLVLTLIRTTLRKDGLRIVETNNGAEVLPLARREGPDLVLLDIGLPGLDGYAACRALKADPVTAGIKVVILSARAQRGDQERGIEAGADAYITKPFSPRELRARVQRLLDE